MIYFEYGLFLIGIILAYKLFIFLSYKSEYLQLRNYQKTISFTNAIFLDLETKLELIIQDYMSLQLAKDNMAKNKVMTNIIFNKHVDKIYSLFIAMYPEKYFSVLLECYTEDQIKYKIIKKLENYVYVNYLFKNKVKSIDDLEGEV